MISHDCQHRDAFDSLEAMRERGGARLIVTSPPFPDARTAEQYGGAVFDTTLDGFGKLGESVFEALVPGGVCALNIDGPIRLWRPELGESERCLISCEVAIDWARRIGFRYIEHVAYVRNAFPTSAGPRWKSGWEPVHVFSRPGGHVFFDRWGSTRKAKHAGKNTQSSGCRRKGERRQSAMKKWVQPDQRCLSTAEKHVNNQSTVDREHPAPFPTTLARDFILCYSRAGEIIGDPFVGSGTVAGQARAHGRIFIGGDFGHRDDGERWADIAADQLRQVEMFAGIEARR